jgi:hypothetical protein
MVRSQAGAIRHPGGELSIGSNRSPTSVSGAQQSQPANGEPASGPAGDRERERLGRVVHQLGQGGGTSKRGDPAERLPDHRFGSFAICVQPRSSLVLMRIGVGALGHGLSRSMVAAPQVEQQRPANERAKE